MGNGSLRFRDNVLIESEPCSAFENRTNKNFLSFSFFLPFNILSYITYIIFEGGECTSIEREREERKVRGWMPRLFYRIIRCNDPRMDLDRDDATYSRLFQNDSSSRATMPSTNLFYAVVATVKGMEPIMWYSVTRA